MYSFFFIVLSMIEKFNWNKDKLFTNISTKWIKGLHSLQIRVFCSDPVFMTRSDPDFNVRSDSDFKISSDPDLV